MKNIFENVEILQEKSHKIFTPVTSKSRNIILRWSTYLLITCTAKLIFLFFDTLASLYDHCNTSGVLLFCVAFDPVLNVKKKKMFFTCMYRCIKVIDTVETLHVIRVFFCEFLLIIFHVWCHISFLLSFSAIWPLILRRLKKIPHSLHLSFSFLIFFPFLYFHM